jgi:hypothetical protein
MSWEDIEDAMHCAVVKASRLPAGQVAWSYQKNVDEPKLDHITILFGGEIPLGIDRVHTSTDLTRPNGQEVKQEVRGVREVPFTFTCFSAEVTGSTAARRLAELTKTRMRLPDIRYPLRKVGLSPFDPGIVNYVPDIPSTHFRGRAVCTIRCYVPVADCIEYTGYIARVTGLIVASGLVSTSYGASGFAFDTNAS